MERIFLFLGMVFVSLTAFCQQETNGTIYIKHPYIDIVNQAAVAYEMHDAGTLKGLYSDTAKFWISGMKKFIPINEAISSWMEDGKYFDSLMQTKQGYPDYLHYKDQDAKVVQSWWRLSGVSKATGKKVVVMMVMFDDFNADGKIVRESIYGDFSEWVKH